MHRKRTALSIWLGVVLPACSHIPVGHARPFEIEVARSCAEECAHGTCNEDLARCDCPPYPHGPAEPSNPCARPSMPHCQPDPARPLQYPCNAIPELGQATRLSCECAAECLSWGILWARLCFGIDDARRNDPQLATATNQSIWAAGVAGNVRLLDISLLDTARAPASPDHIEAKRYRRSDAARGRPAPPHACPHACTDRGYCYQAPQPHNGSAAAAPHCQCFLGFGGDACQHSTGGVYCSNACSGNGVCMSGWCRCRAGFWGVDCSLSRGPRGATTTIFQRWAAAAEAEAAQAGAGPPPHLPPPRPRPRIYVYELPPRLNAWMLFHHHPWVLDSIYSAPRFLLDRLLHSEFREPDPMQADYFLVPLWPHVAAPGPPRAGHRLFHSALRYLSKFPYWQRNNGSDHIWIMPGDLGACDSWGADSGSGPTGRVAEIANSIVVTHFGWTGGSPAYGDPGGAGAGCFRPGQDIVVPPPVPGLPLPGAREDPETPRRVRARDRRNAGATEFEDGWQAWDWTEVFDAPKPLEFFFVGDVRQTGVRNRDGTFWYSHGVRQEVVRRYNSTPGFVVAEARPDHPRASYARDLRSAKFCLAPTGAGWGIRLPQAVLAGCVPVIVADNVTQPFQDLLDYSTFAVRVPERDIPHLRDILAAIAEPQRLAMVKQLKCAWKVLTWSSVHGSLHAASDDGTSDAFAVLLYSLKARLNLSSPRRHASSRVLPPQTSYRTASPPPKRSTRPRGPCALLKLVSADIYPSFKPSSPAEATAAATSTRPKLCRYPMCPYSNMWFERGDVNLGPSGVSTWAPGGAAAVSRPQWLFRGPEGSEDSRPP